MARIRTIKPEFFMDEDVAYLPPLTRLLFVGLWTLADRDGRIEDRPTRIKAHLLPYDDGVDVDDLLDQLQGAGFIHRYEADGKKCLEIRSFSRHQRPHPKEPPSTIPVPPVASREKKRRAVKKNGEDIPSRELTSTSRVDLGMENGSMEDSLEPQSTASKLNEPTAPPVMTFPVVGGDEPEWPLTEDVVSELSRGFPALDIVGECRKARLWVIANDRKRKTPRGMYSFLNGWMQRAQNRGAGARASPPTSTDPQQSRLRERVLAEEASRGTS